VGVEEVVSDAVKSVRVKADIKIKVPANRLETPLDEVAGAVSNPVKRLRPDDVGVGIAVRKDAFPLCMLIRLGYRPIL
jgi:hypothetical protein